ncbi:unnamed protein product [Zymoseptoria tritici ST99CH_3D7]|uniref:Uncharacterized protein n=1 Tax=Zymoseptoria tritici (strain ST99CH_3D7) TaxID=1276538 RepID=A0A1X7S743_ZYMT9|nr:unnamed protein product [Zymoseptoria tritici ST99CH_3D7]
MQCRLSGITEQRYTTFYFPWRSSCDKQDISICPAIALSKTLTASRFFPLRTLQWAPQIPPRSIHLDGLEPCKVPAWRLIPPELPVIFCCLAEVSTP